MTDVLVNHPYVGSAWLIDAHLEGEYVVGWVWDYSGVGSGLMPDDYRGGAADHELP